MKHLKHFMRRSSLLAVAAMFSGVVAAQAIVIPEQVSAAIITDRRLHISNSSSGTEDEGQDVTYEFTFTVPGLPETAVQSMDFQFCTSPLPGIDCDLPVGQDVESASLDDEDGWNGTGAWSLDSATNAWANGDAGSGGLVRITRAETATITADTPVTVTFGGITNPTDDNQTFFVRMVTYEDTAWSDERDQGSVAASTVPQFVVVSRVQETLNFSVGTEDPNGDPGDPPLQPPAVCTPLTNPTVNLGDEDGVLSFTTAYDAFSYFRLSTNALSGVSVYYAGTTLENAGETIAPIGDTASVSVPGTEQFGLALSDINSATFFDEVSATAPYNNGDGVINDDPNVAEFAFDPNSINEPVEIAGAPSAVPCDQGEIRYLGNITVTTAPGIYRAFISYIASPRY